LATDHDTTALVIGGGIAGLTAAIALRQRGIDSLVFEQADDLRKTQVGSGLALGYNVTRALRHLDLLDELAPRGARLTGLRFMTAKGRDLGTASEVEGEMALGILRPAIHHFLVDTVGQDGIQLGAKLERFEQDSSGVLAHFADGRTARGDVLVGADGLRSTVRRQLLDDASEPRYAGYVTRRGILKTESTEEGPEQIFLGRGQRFLYYHVGQDYIYWTAATNEPAGQKEDGAQIKRTVLERFGDWHESVPALVEATDESNTFIADTYDRDPVERWGDGRATLMGDAAHPMTWDRGQGASQCIEDAVLLAKQLAHGDDRATALREWEAQRIPRTGKVVRSSRRLGMLQQSPNPLVGFLHHRVIGF
jgi:2-polyprenyl-6-methoxyphenol hydroxylase-like FAD-dependent oxidoreductase